MIENIRRYTGLIFVVIVVLLLGFIFMDTEGFLRRSGSGRTVVTVDGRAYSDSEFRKLGAAPFELLERLPDYRLFNFLGSLRGDASEERNQALQFFTSRMIVQQAREDFGIHPPKEKVDEAVRSLRIFQAQPPAGAPPGTRGEFDQQSYNRFIQNTLGSFGMVEADFRDLIRDVIAVEELRRVIGGGLEGSREIAEAMAVVRDQEIEASVASIEMQPFIDSLDPSEDALRSWWEERKDRFQTQKKVKLSYTLLSPEYPAEEKEPAAEAEPPSTEDPSDAAAPATEDDPAEADAATDPAADETEKSAPTEAEKAVERQRARDAADKQVALDTDELITQVNDTEGKAFEAAAEALGVEVIRTDWLTADTLPPDLRLSTRSSAASSTLKDIIFNLEFGPDPLACFTDAIPVGKAQFLIVRLDEVEEVRQKTFEEARETVREQYIDEHAKEALMAEVELKTEALKEGLAAGKTFAEAAEDVGLESRKLGPWGASDSLDNEFNARDIFQLASTTNPGEFAEPFVNEDRAVIIHVDARRIEKDDQRGQQVDMLLSNLSRRAETASFDAWLRQRIQQAQVIFPATR